MKPSSWDKQLRLASPLEFAASQDGKNKNLSRNETGLDASHHIRFSPEGRGKNFFLDIPFHRMSAIEIFHRLRLRINPPMGRTELNLVLYA